MRDLVETCDGFVPRFSTGLVALSGIPNNCTFANLSHYLLSSEPGIAIACPVCRVGRAALRRHLYVVQLRCLCSYIAVKLPLNLVKSRSACVRVWIQPHFLKGYTCLI